MAGQDQLRTVGCGGDAPAFGSRFLTDEALVYQHNAWDHVPPPDDQEERVEQALTRQRKNPVADDKKEKYNARPAYYWDIFYRNNQSNFFKNRKWLQREFCQLETITKPEAGQKSILEIGCGAGNAILPLLASNKNPLLRITACDYSRQAVRVVQSNPLYQAPQCGTIQASIWDLSSRTLPANVEEGSVDIIIMVFVLSALHPAEWKQAVANVYTLLKPGGTVLLRDYGRYDLAQLRFKDGRLLDDNFYVRGDGTRVYFFEPTELASLFTGEGIDMPVDGAKIRTLKIIHQEQEAEGDTSDINLAEINNVSQAISEITVDQDSSGATPIAELADNIIDEPNESPLEEAGVSSPGAGKSDNVDIDPQTSTMDPDARTAFFATPIPEPPTDLQPSRTPGDLPPHPLFTTITLGVDRRLIVNRKRQLKMYRVWLQGEWRKNDS